VCHLQDILNSAQVPVSQHLAYLRKAEWVESSRHAQWKIYRLSPLLSPGQRVLLEGLLKAAKTQNLLLSDLEHMEAILKDPRYSFCCDFAKARCRGKKPATSITSE
jgi:DNA-binding transcriptional ArsR family regulator